MDKSSLHPLRHQSHYTVNGRRVQGDGGDIQLPEFGDIEIGSNGMINLTPIGGGVIAEDAQIKLASTDANLIKGADGLLRANDLQPLEADETITVRTGALVGRYQPVIPGVPFIR